MKSGRTSAYVAARVHQTRSFMYRHAREVLPGICLALACSVGKDDYSYRDDGADRASVGGAAVGGASSGGSGVAGGVGGAAKGSGGDAGRTPSQQAGGSTDAAGGEGAGSGIEQGEGGAPQAGLSGAAGCSGSGEECGCSGEPCPPRLTGLVPLAQRPMEQTLVTAMVPSFSPEHLTYEIETSFWLTQLRLDLTANEGSIVIVDGTPRPASSAVINLQPGDNSVEVEVRGEDEAVTYYLVIRRREPLRISAADVAVRRFGEAVAVQGDLLVVGAPESNDGAGSVHTFQRVSPGEWNELPMRRLTGAGALGASLTLDETTLLIGAQFEDTSGTLHFYGRGPSAWQEQRTAFGPAFPASGLGAAVAVSTSYAAAASDNFNQLHTYTRLANGTWTEDDESPLEAEDGFAFIEGAVALSGSWLAIGSHNRTTGPGTFILHRTGPTAGWAPFPGGDAVLQGFGMFGDSIAMWGS
ncbi:MAG TPA: cadherin-like beta sandwich domain-containing protein, partial [Polyangiaceae bacterium]|nr:cadherin-like beta sandwich domain-containing protein [Polyangiaceae bacterium]